MTASERTYYGETGGLVTFRDTGAAERQVLPLRLDLVAHSPTGFAWGYAGSGPAQLALALLADVIGDERACALYQLFKFRVVAQLRSHWHLRRSEILEHVAAIERDAVSCQQAAE